MSWLTRDEFIQSHVEIGAGTCLQPLLRFSDRCRDFLFIDGEDGPDTIPRDVDEALRRLAAQARSLGVVPPLVLDGIEVAERLDVDDFELIGSPARIHDLTARALGPHLSSVKELLCGFARLRPQQWGIRCALTRQIEHVDGSVEKRPLTLRFVGGEGIHTWIALGGLETPARSIGTVQTGLAELEHGPLAYVFERQAERGLPLPKRWVRGYADPWFNHWYARRPQLEAAPPYTRVGQRYTRWVSDRDFPGALDLRRAVAAWTMDAGDVPPAPVAVGPHRIVSTTLDRAAVEVADAACLPRHLAARLGVASLPHVHVVEPSPNDLMLPLAHGLRAWTKHPTFLSATQAVLVVQGYEDELGAVARLLASTVRPRVQVHLPMPLDHAAAVAAVASLTPDRPASSRRGDEHPLTVDNRSPP